MLLQTEREDAALVRGLFLPGICGVPRQAEVLADTMRDANLHSRMLDESSDPIFSFDPDLRYLYANQAYADGIGRNLDEIIGLTVWDVFPKYEADKRSTLAKWVFDHREAKTHEMLVRGRNGERHYLTTVTPILGDRGQVLCVLANSKDITKRKQAESVLKASEEKYRALVETTSTGYLILDKDGKVIDANAEYVRLSGYSELREILGRSVLEWTAEYEIERNNKAVAQCTRDGFIRNLVVDYVDRNGLTTPIEINATVIGEGDSVQVISLCRDITERKLIEAALQESEQKFRLIAENTSDGITIFGKDDVIKYVSPSVCKQLGYSEQEQLGWSSADVYALVHPTGRDALFQEIKEAIQAKGERLTCSYRIKHKSGYYVWREDSTNFRYTSSGEYDGAYMVSRDISPRKRTEEELHRLAFFDPLTQLPNRHTLSDRLNQTMSASKRSGNYGALMMLDLDNFKPLNDAHGHHTGDLLLLEVAKRLTECVRETDIVARVGGDEFVVILGELNPDPKESARQATEVAEKIRASLAAHYRLILDKGSLAGGAVEHRCSVSIGVALFLDHEASQSDLLKWADSAMYRAKEAGRNAIRFYGLTQ